MNSNKKKIRLLISYEGTNYYGWQTQKSTLPTIQGTLEQILNRLLSEPIQVVGSGRTDRGVHALAQIAHFTTSKNLTLFPFLRALNSLLPSDIVVHQAWEAPEEFHAMLSAIQKTYHYWILNRPQGSALRNRHLYWLRRPIDINYLSHCCPFILGSHDFASFRTTGTQTPSTTREVFVAKWEKKGNSLLKFSITANGFLKQMVRNIVGTMLDLHFSQRPPSDIKNILEAKDRRQALGTAPSHGLYLYRVIYPRELDKKCRTL